MSKSTGKRVHLSPTTALFAVIACTSSAMAQDVPTLSGCASDTPPFVHMKNGRGDSGFSVDLFQKVAVQLNRKGVILEMPWARCLNEVSAGRVDVAIDAYDDPERRKLFFYSIPYYTLTPQIFYRSTANPKVWPVQNASQLRQFKGCGLREYTYEHYDLDAKTMDLGATSDKQMLQKLLAKRCDYGLEELEYVVGGRNSESDWPDESSLRSYRPGWARAPQVHYLIGRNRAGAEVLQQQLNTAIVALEKLGDVSKLSQQYFQTKARTKRNAKDTP